MSTSKLVGTETTPSLLIRNIPVKLDEESPVPVSDLKNSQISWAAFPKTLTWLPGNSFFLGSDLLSLYQINW